MQRSHRCDPYATVEHPKVFPQYEQIRIKVFFILILPPYFLLNVHNETLYHILQLKSRATHLTNFCLYVIVPCHMSNTVNEENLGLTIKRKAWRTTC
ncbi:MAG: hypothetical protein CR972_00515 [Candidatus Moraniibacteriota bacterium]|nr:MAG: hypothetical protein CR972_00515 [Candidatus Moranbacteria bacterium]